MEEICRLCLCKCENPRNMLEDTDFAGKVMEVFPKIKISSENGFTTAVCDYCHDLVQQFYGYFESVNANQQKLMKKLTEIPKEVVFAEPISKMEVSDPSMDADFDREIEEDLPKKPLMVPKSLRKQKKTDYTNEELLQMNYFELHSLPLNFTSHFRCPLCTESDQYRIKSHLKAHIMSKHLTHLKATQRPKAAESHLRKLESVCEICGQILAWAKTSQNFQDHKFLHYDIKPYKCDLCHFCTTRKTFINTHIIKNHLKRQKRCSACWKICDSADLRMEHFQKRHPEKLFECENCDLKFMSELSLKKHRILERNLFRFECPRCPGGLRFPNEKVLALHQERHLLEDKSQKSFACHLCERKFTSQKILNSHLKLHKEKRLKCCEICGKTVTMKHLNGNISPHMRQVHSKPKSLKCDNCEKEFPNKMLLSIHFRKTHDAKEQSCFKCGKMIPQFTITRHLKFCIGGEKKCAHCPMIFKTSSLRQKHTMEFHTGYKCIKCDVQFENASEYHHHMRYKSHKLMKRKK